MHGQGRTYMTTKDHQAITDKATKGHIRPNKAIKAKLGHISHTRPHKAREGHTRPYKVIKCKAIQESNRSINTIQDNSRSGKVMPV